LTLEFGGTISRSCAGGVATVDQPALGGRPFQMSVNPDGRAGLMTLHDGATSFDLVLIYADGRIEHLSSDGDTELPRWQR
jgi:hypothetical protein